MLLKASIQSMGKKYFFKKGQLVKDAYGVVDKPGAKVRLKIYLSN